MSTLPRLALAIAFGVGLSFTLFRFYKKSSKKQAYQKLSSMPDLMASVFDFFDSEDVQSVKDSNFLTKDEWFCVLSRIKKPLKLHPSTTNLQLQDYKTIRYLSLRHCKLINAGLQHLTSIRWLDLTGCSHIEDDDLKLFALGAKHLHKIGRAHV